MRDKKPCCQGVDGSCENEGIRRRQNTAYAVDEFNWVTMCDECFELNEAYWAEQWRELR